MYLGIEIGGTKLQLAVGDGQSGRLIALQRFQVDPQLGAGGILEQIDRSANSLLQKHAVQAIGIGFGGPVDAPAGRVIKSHQVEGWENFQLGQWCEQNFNKPTRLGNDCDCATLAEATFGVGALYRSVFYVTVGTGIGGGFCIDRKLLGGPQLGGMRAAIAEIGHLRPGPQSDREEMTVESIASGSGIANSARARIAGMVAGSVEEFRQDYPLSRPEMQMLLANASQTDREYVQDLLDRCQHDLNQLDGRMVAQAAMEGNEIARMSIHHGIEVLGWAIAQMITLLAPEIVIVGGGVSLMGKENFFTPLRQQVERYVFPVLRESYRIEAAKLGEEVVTHGAILLAQFEDNQQ
jgi:glucokinase